VSIPRQLEATELLHVPAAAGKKLLDQKRKEQRGHLERRNEVIP